MEDDKKREFLDDVTGSGASNCCGAATWEFGESYMCKKCGEHCDISNDE